jgi:hypothetical protein
MQFFVSKNTIGPFSLREKNDNENQNGVFQITYHLFDFVANSKFPLTTRFSFSDVILFYREHTSATNFYCNNWIAAVSLCIRLILFLIVQGGQKTGTL